MPSPQPGDERLGVDELVGALGQEHLADAGGERGERRPGPAVVHHRAAGRQDAGQRDPAVDADAVGNGAESRRVIAERDDHLDVQTGELRHDLAQDVEAAEARGDRPEGDEHTRASADG